MSNKQFIFISLQEQYMFCFENDKMLRCYPISSAKNGVGERYGSECTPRGWHLVHDIIGKDAPLNAVFIAREWTKEIYSEDFAKANPDRDWILTRILQLRGLEPGRNSDGDVDSFNRRIYIHGTPDSVNLSIPGSRGCIRMRNSAVIELATWVKISTRVCIE